MDPPKNSDPEKFSLLSRREVEGMIANGRSIIIINKKVLRVDAWIKYHPGGHLPIQHMVGKDATDEVTAMHSESTLEQMNRYQIGRIEGRWHSFTPPVQGGRFRHLAGDTADNHAYVNENKTGLLETFRTTTIPKVVTPSEKGPQGGLVPSDPAKAGGPGFLDTQTHREIELTVEQYPSLDDPTQDEIVEKYRRVHTQIQAEGLYKCNYVAYAWEMARCSLLFGSMLLFLRAEWYCTSALSLGFFWSQMTFAAHDAGHMGITHNFTIDTLIAMMIATPVGGISMGWWKRTHNVHHIVTNSPEHDPDNQHLPVFAVNHRFLGNIFSTYHKRVLPYDAVAKFLVPYQAFLYYPVLMFARFNLYAQSIVFLAEGQGPRKGVAWWHRWFEIVGMGVFWFWYGYVLVYSSIPTASARLAFVMISHMAAMPLHVQFTLSHFAMSTADLGANESFPQKMLRTTMDIDCPEWLDWYHGGLQFQAIHHLYPRIPRHNLRRTQKLVQRFCNEVNIPYALYGYANSNKKVLSSLAEVSRQAAILAKCQQTMVQQGDPLHN